MSVTAFTIVVAIVLGSLSGIGLCLSVIYGYYRSKRKIAEAQNVWDLIPSWQYTGLHIASGGLTRDEQERAIQEVQELAQSLDEDDETVP